MKRDDLVNKIESDLNEINPDARPTSIKNHIQSAARALNLIGAGQTNLFKKYATDLLQLLSGELSFQKINKKAESAFSDSFFRSFEILKKEILQALQNLSK